MNNPHQPPPDSSEPQAPPGLVDDLRALHGSGGTVPPELDQAIRATARLHFAQHARRRLFLRTLPYVGVAAAAAVVALALLLPNEATRLMHTGWHSESPRSVPHEAPIAYGPPASPPGETGDVALDQPTRITAFAARSREATPLTLPSAAPSAAPGAASDAGVSGPVAAKTRAATIVTRPAPDACEHSSSILDAFALARNLRDGVNVKGEWDCNGDGVVDRRDVDAMAASAVRMHKGT